MVRSAKSGGNTIYVLYALIKKLKIPVSFFTLKKDLLDHPDYPSMLALSDCLTSWKVPHKAFMLDKNGDDINELSFPFIANLKREVLEFVLVQKIEGSIVYFCTEREQNGVLKLPEFLKLWDGTILYAEKEIDSGEKEYHQSLIKNWMNNARLPFLVLVILCSIIYTIDHNLSWGQLPYLGLVLIKLFGLGVSSLLLVHSVSENNPFVQNLCSNNKKNSCNAILKSDAAKLTSWLSWSEIGMFYFAGSLFFLLLNPAHIIILSWLNILSLPYTLYSIGYQVRLKNWCVLCCTVQALLWLEAIGFLIGGATFATLNLRLSDTIAFLLCFMIPIAFWAFIKPFILKAEQLNPLNNQLKRFKYNSVLFNQLLRAQPRYAIPDDLRPVLLGNPEAEIVITIVSNLFCSPCGAAHRILEEWLYQRNDIQLKVLFTSADDDARNKIVRHVMALSLLEDKSIVEQALRDWYNQTGKNYERWAEKYPIGKFEGIEMVTQKQKDWCKMADISFTPTIFINGYKLIEPYRLEDIKYLLTS